MRLLAVLIIPLIAAAAQVEDEPEFGAWQRFPGPNPELTDILQEVDSGRLFRVGQIVFTLPDVCAELPRKAIARTEPSITVDEIIENGRPSKCILEIAQNQLGFEADADFVNASIFNCGDARKCCVVTYELRPKEGGTTGVPYQVRTMLDQSGGPYEPDLAIFDAYFHTDAEGWTVSVLTIPKSENNRKTLPSAEHAAELAQKQLSAYVQGFPADTIDKLHSRLKLKSQRKLQIPCYANANGDIGYIDIWAVNFSDSGRVKNSRPDEVLTIWVGSNGAACLRQITSESLLNSHE